MRMFDNAVDWERTGNGGLSFSHPDSRGKQRVQALERRPEELWLQLESLSLFNETAWQFQDKYNPEIETGYSAREYISGSASLVGCRIHGISLDDTPNVAFVRLDVSIYPISLEELKETTHSLLSFPPGEVPEGGILKDSLGELVYYWADDEVQWRPELYAILHLDHDSFNNLARKIQSGGIRSARMRVLADLFGLDWGGLPGADADYVILLEDEGSSKRGRAKARLNKVLLEWSSVFDSPMGLTRNERSKIEAPVKSDGPGKIDRPEPDLTGSSKQETETSGWSSFLRRFK